MRFKSTWALVIYCCNNMSLNPEALSDNKHLLGFPSGLRW